MRGMDDHRGSLFSYVDLTQDPDRPARHAGDAVSQRLRKRIEEGFGWIKTTGGLAKTRHRGLDRVGWMFTLTVAAYNLVRLPKLMAEAAIRCPQAAEPTPSAATTSGPLTSIRSTTNPAKLTKRTKPAANGGFFSSLLIDLVVRGTGSVWRVSYEAVTQHEIRGRPVG